MMKLLNRLSLLIILSVFAISCQDEMPTETETNAFKESGKISKEQLSRPELKRELPQSLFNDDFPVRSIEEIEECDDYTPFSQALDESISSNLDYLGFVNYEFYLDLNFYGTLMPQGDQYFGDKGHYTNYVNNRVRNLEKFWNMPNEVTVRGQHGETLDDKQKIIDILNFWYYVEPGEPEEIADEMVDFINVESTFLVETPYISFDGFAIALGGFFGQGDVIVIGDGLVEIASDAGVEDKVVWSGILAHEWAHQIQFNEGGVWYPEGVITRTTELEADYFTGFYLTHKRGGTYNWKRVQGFLELFYNIGDCAFTSPNHHGTPDQRMRAAEKGYALAQSIKVNGKIMTADQVHEYFMNDLDGILVGN